MKRFAPALSFVLIAASLMPAQSKPNIVFMLSDDQPWNGLSVAMHPDVATSKSRFVETPNLERLAEQGMRFSSAYSPAPMCGPTRMSLQTGKTPAAVYWQSKTMRCRRGAGNAKLTVPFQLRDVPERERTIGELLQSAGYATAHFGKWHIGGGGPGQNGYDEHDGDQGNEAAAKFADPNPVDIFGMAKRATAFMKRNAADKKPFYIQLSWLALHSPDNALKQTIAKYRAKLGDTRAVNRAALAEDLDTGVGMVLDAIDKLGIAGNTYVIYMSDNGGGGGGRRNNGQNNSRRRNARNRGRRNALNGGKGSLWEGGVRVPFLIRGPGIAADSWSHVPIHGVDLLPTFCEWAGVEELPNGIEGGSFATVLAAQGDGDVRRPHEGLVFYHPQYSGAEGPHASIRVGNLKLIEFFDKDEVVLFDLAKDLTETNDLAESQAADADQLRKQLHAQLAAIGAILPKPNPDYDPLQPTTQRTRRRR